MILLLNLCECSSPLRKLIRRLTASRWMCISNSGRLTLCPSSTSIFCWDFSSCCVFLALQDLQGRENVKDFNFLSSNSHTRVCVFFNSLLVVRSRFIHIHMCLCCFSMWGLFGKILESGQHAVERELPPWQHYSVLPPATICRVQSSVPWWQQLTDWSELFKICWFIYVDLCTESSLTLTGPSPQCARCRQH